MHRECKDVPKSTKKYKINLKISKKLRANKDLSENKHPVRVFCEKSFYSSYVAFATVAFATKKVFSDFKTFHKVQIQEEYFKNSKLFYLIDEASKIIKTLKFINDVSSTNSETNIFCQHKKSFLAASTCV